MREGEFEDGEHILRAKIDMGSPNMKMRDPLLYRIVKKAPHYRTKDDWAIYPMYDFAHCLSDYIEGVTHSFCTLGVLRNNRELLWIWDYLETPLKAWRPSKEPSFSIEVWPRTSIMELLPVIEVKPETKRSLVG